MSGSTDEPCLSVKELTVRDQHGGRTVVDRASFQVLAGEFVCLVGPSGSGKSTTALSLMGLLQPPLQVVGGSGLLAGQPIDFGNQEGFADLRGRRASMVFQDPFSSLNPVLRCGHQVEEPLRIHTRATRAERRDAAMAVLSEVGFADPVRTYSSLPSELSGGQLQRVMIAMAVALEPAVLFADEPTTALDPESQRGIVELLRNLKSRRGLAVLLITHNMDLARSISDRVLRMRDGCLLDDAETNLRVSQSAAVPAAGPQPLRSPKETPGSSVQTLLTVRRVSKTFVRRRLLGGISHQVKALQEVSFEIRRGEIVGVAGPSGSGKTTLGRCVAGLELPDRGEILVDERPVPTRHRRGSPSPIQLIYQSPYASLNPTMRAGEAVEEGLRSHGLPAAIRRDTARHLLAEVGIGASLCDRFPHELSGGERQRVVIARALAAEPKLLVADEPTASLDEVTGVQVLDLLRRLCHERGLAVLLISHDEKVIALCADRVLSLQDGQLAQTASPDGPERRVISLAGNSAP